MYDNFSVHIVQETAPCKEWSVWLFKPGGRFLLKSFGASQFQQADAYAWELATFLEVSLQLDSESS